MTKFSYKRPDKKKKHGEKEKRRRAALNAKIVKKRKDGEWRAPEEDNQLTWPDVKPFNLGEPK